MLYEVALGPVPDWDPTEGAIGRHVARFARGRAPRLTAAPKLQALAKRRPGLVRSRTDPTTRAVRRAFTRKRKRGRAPEELDASSLRSLSRRRLGLVRDSGAEEDAGL